MSNQSNHIVINQYLQDISSLVDNTIDVWFGYVDEKIYPAKSSWNTLSIHECKRADRYRFEDSRMVYIWSTLWLRQLLGNYLFTNPNELEILTTPSGKPFVRNELDIRFNISRSGNRVVIAMVRNRDVGVDIEKIKANIPLMDMAKDYFSKQEFNLLMKIGPDARPALFFQIWTRKESFVKAVGEGVSFPLQDCNLSGINPIRPSEVLINSEDKHYAGFYGLDLKSPNGYLASVVTEGSDWETRYLELRQLEFE